MAEVTHNKSFEYAPSGPDALTRAAQFKRYERPELRQLRRSPESEECLFLGRKRSLKLHPLPALPDRRQFPAFASVASGAERVLINLGEVSVDISDKGCKPFLTHINTP